MGPSVSALYHLVGSVTPGERGSAVLAGHTSHGTSGIGSRMANLDKGNLVKYAVGKKVSTFKVKLAYKVFNPTPKMVHDWYTLEGPSRLVLLTCGDYVGNGEYRSVIVRVARKVRNN